MALLLEFLATVPKKEAIEDLSIITGCDQSILSTFMYVSLSVCLSVSLSVSHTLKQLQIRIGTPQEEITTNRRKGIAGFS